MNKKTICKIIKRGFGVVAIYGTSWGLGAMMFLDKYHPFPGLIKSLWLFPLSTLLIVAIVTAAWGIMWGIVWLVTSDC